MNHLGPEISCCYFISRACHQKWVNIQRRRGAGRINRGLVPRGEVDTVGCDHIEIATRHNRFNPDVVTARRDADVAGAIAEVEIFQYQLLIKINIYARRIRNGMDHLNQGIGRSKWVTAAAAAAAAAGNQQRCCCQGQHAGIACAVLHDSSPVRLQIQRSFRVTYV